MLVFDLRTLASAAAQVHDVLPTDDPVWTELDNRPVDGVQVTGRLSAAGPGRFYFSGQVSGTARGECRRCLTEVTAPVSESAQLIFVEQGEDDLDDPDVFVFDPRPNVLDLRPAIREQWLVAAPAFVQCRDECRGLCPTCGADLNAGTCACEPAVSR
ncbi:MAG TPA: DUF177 domain-containing protein [Gemmatimonadaceae bacterium]|jgi:uncharacterized protein|nr:DUF177 domain-containing protein [Gemmatimonadaceae bacterium]